MATVRSGLGCLGLAGNAMKLELLPAEEFEAPAVFNCARYRLRTMEAMA